MVRFAVAVGALAAVLAARALADVPAPTEPSGRVLPDEARSLGAFARTFHTPPALHVPGSRALPVGLVVVEGDPSARELQRGALLAVDEANDRGGLDGRPFVLEVGESRGPWSSAAGPGRDLVYEKDCLGILSPPSGEVAHLLAQVAIRGRAPLLSLSGETSLTRIPDPWVFRVVPGRVSEIRALVARLGPEDREGPIPAVVPAGRPGRVVREELAALTRAGGPVFGPVLAEADLASAADLARGVKGSSALLLVVSERRVPEILSLLDRIPWRGVVLAECGLASGRAFPAVPGIEVLTATLLDPASEAGRAFVASYRRRYGAMPGEAAACAYDAASVLMEAVRRRGPDRAAIRDWLATSERWSTVTGLAGFDGAGGREPARRELHTADGPRVPPSNCPGGSAP